MASRSSRITNSGIIELSTTRLTGIKNYITNQKTEIPIAGQLLKPPAVAAIFQASLDTRAAVAAKKAELKAAQSERDAAEAARADADDALKGWVTNRFGQDSTEAHSFGYAPKKAAVITVDTKKTAITRNKATREARHTLGPKKKLEIKGTAVVLTSSLTPATIITAAPAATTASAVVPAVASMVTPVATPVVNPVVAAAAATVAPVVQPAAAAVVGDLVASPVQAPPAVTQAPPTSAST